VNRKKISSFVVVGTATIESWPMEISSTEAPSMFLSVLSSPEHGRRINFETHFGFNKLGK
jgi:hypothetical protein